MSVDMFHVFCQKAEKRNHVVYSNFCQSNEPKSINHLDSYYSTWVPRCSTKIFQANAAPSLGLPHLNLANSSPSLGLPHLNLAISSPSLGLPL